MQMTLAAMFIAVSLIAVSPGGAWAADPRIEGTVTGTTLTKCEFKPGTCEGSLVLEEKAGAKPTPVTIKVTKGTTITKGTDHLFLPGLKGSLVTVTYVEEKGEKVAKAIEVKTVTR